MPTPKEWAENLERLHKIAYPGLEQKTEDIEKTKEAESSQEASSSTFDESITKLAEETIRLMDHLDQEKKVIFLKFILSLIILETYERADGK